MTREELVKKARVLIQAQPEAGRRVIASALRQEYGSGLRDATILALQREYYPERRQVIVPSYLFGEPQGQRYKHNRQSRYDYLLKQNFTKKEASLISVLVLSNKPFTKALIKARKDVVAGLEKEKLFAGWSKTQLKSELINYIEYNYKDKGWTTRAGELNPFEMLIEYAGNDKELINALRDEYEMRKSSRSNKQRMLEARWKGDTIGQHKRWRAEHKDEIREAKQAYRQRVKAAQSK